MGQKLYKERHLIEYFFQQSEALPPIGDSLWFILAS